MENNPNEYISVWEAGRSGRDRGGREAPADLADLLRGPAFLPLGLPGWKARS